MKVFSSFLKLKIFYSMHVCKELTPWKRLWCWEGLGAGGEGDNRGWDGWMTSPTRWMWVWVNSGSWWWTGRPGVLQFMESQRVGHYWATELNWRECSMTLIVKTADMCAFSIHFGFFGRAHHAICGLLVPQPEVQPECPALDSQSPNHWTTKEVPSSISY